MADRATFVHGDAAGHVSAGPVDVAACIGATWIGDGPAGTVGLLARSPRPGGTMLIGEPFWRDGSSRAGLSGDGRDDDARDRADRGQPGVAAMLTKGLR